ncbi:hypothetical protein AB0F20_34740, partial [Streptomyces goshikiensis]
MRILFTTWAAPSHLFPLVPLAWAARVAGHEVLLAVADAAAELSKATGREISYLPVSTEDYRAVLRE